MNVQKRGLSREKENKKLECTVYFSPGSAISALNAL